MKNFDLKITKGLVRLLLFNKDITKKNPSFILSSLFKRQLFNLGSILFLILGMAALAPAQTLYDSFGDGNFTASPAWSGDAGSWSITTNSSSGNNATGTSNTLRLSFATNNTSGVQQLRSQISTWGTTQEWGFWLGRVSSSTYTSTNNTFIWLYANEADLETNTVDGYRLRIGDDDNNGDKIFLQSVTNGVGTDILTSSGAITNGVDDISILLRVTRNAAGKWELFTSTLPTGNGNGVAANATSSIASSTNASVFQGTVTNTTFTPAANGYLGIVAVHSGGNTSRAAVEFDQIYFSADPPQIALTSSALSLCRGTTSLTLPYTLSNSPTQYKIDYDATANTAGLADVAFTNLPGSSPLTLTIPAGISAGTYNGTVTVRDGNGRTGSFQSFTVTVNLTSATANAGADQSFCATSVTLAGSVGGTATTGTWTTNGTGMFGNANVLNTTYTPSSADITAGSVTLTLTSNDPGGACPGAASDQMILTTVATQTLSFPTGTSTFVVPAGVTSITVEAVGGGGSGGGISGNGNGDRAGGGGGAYASSVLSVSAGTSHTVVVGAGGAAGTAANGTASSFGTTLVVAAPGTNGGVDSGNPGAGGTTTASTGTIKFAGGSGGNNNGNAGGGGGGAGTAAGNGGPGGVSGNGSTGGTGGKAGNTPTPTAGTGTGAAGDGGNGGNDGVAGGNALVQPGGGGGGRGDSGETGGAGAAGQVKVSWPCNCVDLSNLTTTATTPICSGGVSTVRWSNYAGQ